MAGWSKKGIQARERLVHRIVSCSVLVGLRGVLRLTKKCDTVEGVWYVLRNESGEFQQEVGIEGIDQESKELYSTRHHQIAIRS